MQDDRNLEAPWVGKSWDEYINGDEEGKEMKEQAYDEYIDMLIDERKREE